MVDTSPSKNLSKIIEERIRWAQQGAKRSLDMLYNYFECQETYEYASTLEKLYELVIMKAPEVLREIEELVKNTQVDSYDIDKLKLIGEYIRRNIHITEDDKTRNQKIQKLKEGLKLLSDKQVDFELYKIHRDTGKYLPKFKSHLEELDEYLRNSTGQGLDFKILLDIKRNVARNNLSCYIYSLLSNPEEFMQHMKAGNLEAFVRESCKSTSSFDFSNKIYIYTIFS